MADSRQLVLVISTSNYYQHDAALRNVTGLGVETQYCFGEKQVLLKCVHLNQNSAVIQCEWHLTCEGYTIGGS